MSGKVTDSQINNQHNLSINSDGANEIMTDELGQDFSTTQHVHPSFNNDQGSLSKESDPDSEDKKINKEPATSNEHNLNELQSKMDIGFQNCDKQMAGLQLKSERESIHSQNSNRTDHGPVQNLIIVHETMVKPGSTSIPNIGQMSPDSPNYPQENPHK